MKELWTDGSASPNPGPGGWAVLEDGRPVALGGERMTTNIRMEGSALIAAMKYADGKPVEIWTDSQFWVNVLTKWSQSWERRNWHRLNGRPIENPDLVKKAHGLYRQGNVSVRWVRGHAGTEMNELADIWANRARCGERMEDVK